MPCLCAENAQFSYVSFAKKHTSDLSILISGGKETNKDSLSNGEQRGNSSNLKSPVPAPANCSLLRYQKRPRKELSTKPQKLHEGPREELYSHSCENIAVRNLQQLPNASECPGYTYTNINAGQ